MTPTKILYVDDEAMALKYFERLVSPLAPVLTAGSVEEGRAMLLAHGADVAVLVCDQRMPGERGNELLRARKPHSSVPTSTEKPERPMTPWMPGLRATNRPSLLSPGLATTHHASWATGKQEEDSASPCGSASWKPH